MTQYFLPVEFDKYIVLDQDHEIRLCYSLAQTFAVRNYSLRLTECSGDRALAGRNDSVDGPGVPLCPGGQSLL